MDIGTNEESPGLGGDSHHFSDNQQLLFVFYSLTLLYHSYYVLVHADCFDDVTFCAVKQTLRTKQTLVDHNYVCSINHKTAL